MRRTVLILFLAAAAALAQNTTTKTPATAPAKAARRSATAATKSKTIAPTEPVIVIHGLCDSPSKLGSKASACATVFTRREFEAFVEVLNSTSTRGIDPALYRGAAEGYTILQVGADAGQKAGVDKDPRFEQVLEAARMRAIGAMYRAQKFRETLQVPAGEIEAYYKKNIDGYEEVDLDRFLLPKNNPANLSDEAFREKVKRVADEMHARALKGEDIAKLEKEGLEALGLDSPLPVVAIGVRRGQVEEKADKEIFALGQGDVTSVLDERALWMFFKRTGRQTLSLEMVGPEIRAKLFREKLDMIDKTLHDAVHVDYNEAFFGPSPAAGKTGNSAKAAESPAKAEEKPATPAQVAARDAVMTIHGLCGSHRQDSVASSCTLVITREQFEPVLKVTLLTASKSTPASLRGVAEGYLDSLIYGEAGERAGVEKDPRFADVMKLARQRALSDMYRLIQDEKAHQVPAEKIAAYYKEHTPNFEELQLRHVSIPRENANKSDDPGYDAKAKKLASELRERAAKGEDMDKLQKEGYETLGLKNPPPVPMNPIRKGSLDESAEREVFALKPGEVTTVREFPPAYVFYALDSRRMITLDEATPEISQMMYRERLETQMKQLGESVRSEYNEEYFRSVVHADSGSASTRASVSPTAGAGK